MRGMAARKIPYGALMIVISFFLAQIGFSYGLRIGQHALWPGTKTFKPELAIVMPPPTARTVKAIAFGDEQFYFRMLSFLLQNAGDTYGRATPLKDYDYTVLYAWWLLLDALDAQSNIIPALASYYYSASQESLRDVPYVVRYLEQHADRYPAVKWWWYAQAAYLARHKLHDMDLALRLANKLANIPKEVKMPLWARQMPAFIHEAKGELEEAYIIIRDILDNYQDIPEGEINYMLYFIKDRVKKFEEYEQRKNIKTH